MKTWANATFVRIIYSIVCDGTAARYEQPSGTGGVIVGSDSQVSFTDDLTNQIEFTGTGGYEIVGSGVPKEQ
ncbi:hypothetical protein Psch_01636 [Pelotomaculum schinkii]|uniref:Uncharacterized protein n=1 Tax=Pelotomaculum schinkii TaxID=78350 RepID=A0A4Y7RH17_9FIRM|nr:MULTISPECIES: hypothetical protein [Pelotomaculum]TEB08081.1 hypothetical protein Psch_01636 [Pelotomaculum schinkii]TEB15773.1 hypothetical protein Psfp_01858 [Pelotomaculum sp. FP]